MTATDEASALAAEGLLGYREIYRSVSAVAGKQLDHPFLERALEIGRCLESGQSTIVATAYVEALERVSSEAKLAWRDHGAPPGLALALAALDKAKREAGE